MDPDEADLRLVAIICLTVLLGLAIVGITVVAVATDRDLWRAEALTFAGAVLLTGLGGVSWAALRRRRRWHVSVDREGNGK